MRKNRLYLFLLLVFSLLSLADLFRPGLPVTHDGQDHVARIANFYQSLSEGNLIPRWAANLNWGYGHPILMFLYPLASYLASLFHFLGFSLVDSTKTVFGLSFVFSGVFMYLWIKEIWGKEAGFVAGLIYMFAPYRFVDLYVRGALGECLAFVWPPIICYFAYKLSRQQKWSYLIAGSFSLAALILSHNALSLMFLPIIFGYMGYLVLTSKGNYVLRITYCVLLVLFGFALSAFFWLPAFFEGKYTLRDIVTKNQIVGFEPIERLIWSSWNYGGTGQFNVQVGIIQWLVILFTPFLIWQLRRRKEKIWQFLLFLLVIFWLAIFLISPQSRFLYLKINLLQKFQFAWRWLSLTIFPPAIFAGLVIYLLPRKLKFLCSMLFVLCSLLLNKNYWRAKDFLQKPDSFYTQPYPSPTDTGESAPIWSVRFMEKFPEAHLEVIKGKAMVEEIGRKTNRHEYRIIAEQSTRLVENTLYFPGWQVLVSTKGGPASGGDGQPVEIQFQDPDYRGLMTFNVSKGEHQIVIQFGETKLRQFANLVSLGFLIALVLGAIVITLFKK